MVKGDGRKVDRAVQRAAGAISRAIDKMIVDLPEGAAPQMALERLVGELVLLQQWPMDLIMEDPDFREAYNAAVAELPATAKPRRGITT
jgi:hypothetical protein